MVEAVEVSQHFHVKATVDRRYEDRVEDLLQDSLAQLQEKLATLRLSAERIEVTPKRVSAPKQTADRRGKK